MTAPDLVLYSKPGCHLCEETRAFLDEWLAARASEGVAVPALVERDITTDERWYAAFWDTIPVLELGDRRLPLAIRPSQVTAFLDRALEASAAAR